MQPGDTECPFLYKPTVIYQTKKESLDDDLGMKPVDRKNLINAIQRINENPEYLDSIIMIGVAPFFVMYATVPQVHCYKEYSRTHNRHSSICVDSTGGLVHKVKDLNGNPGGHIFLYEIVINFDGTSQTIYQMLSEVHDTDFISYWFKKWLRLTKNRPPREAVSDGARALLNAMCDAFNKCPLVQYIELCYQDAKKMTQYQPTTYIRQDTAHFIHAATQWDCLKAVLHLPVKKFFIFCIGLLVDCTSIENFERVFQLILVVFESMYEDTVNF